MRKFVLKADTGHFTIGPTTTTGTVTLSVPAKKSARAMVADQAVKSKKIESAVYAHIQAVRALGRTQIEPEEIARALGLSVSQVHGTLAALKSKGVKTIHAP